MTFMEVDVLGLITDNNLIFDISLNVLKFV